MRCFTSPSWIVFGTLMVTACFPDFQFGPGSEGGGDASSSRGSGGPLPGAGGGNSSTGVGGNEDGGFPNHGGEGGGGVTATGSSSTGVIEMPTVPCGNGSSVIVECTAAQDCCFSSESATYDHCGASGSCNDYVFTCNEPDDCASGVCCADEDFLGFTGTISCVSSCSGSTLCAQTSDCSGGETCEQYFSNSYAPEYAPAYKVCTP